MTHNIKPAINIKYNNFTNILDSSKWYTTNKNISFNPSKTELILNQNINEYDTQIISIIVTSSAIITFKYMCSDKTKFNIYYVVNDNIVLIHDLITIISLNSGDKFGFIFANKNS